MGSFATDALGLEWRRDGLTGVSETLEGYTDIRLRWGGTDLGDLPTTVFDRDRSPESIVDLEVTTELSGLAFRDGPTVCRLGGDLGGKGSPLLTIKSLAKAHSSSVLIHETARETTVEGTEVSELDTETSGAEPGVFSSSGVDGCMSST